MQKKGAKSEAWYSGKDGEQVFMISIIMIQTYRGTSNGVRSSRHFGTQTSSTFDLSLGVLNEENKVIDKR